MKKIKYILIVLVLSFSFILNVNAVDNFAINWICDPGDPCPAATTIFGNIDTDKTTYLPRENVQLWAGYSSDDHPLPVDNITPVAYGRINAAGYTASPDIFPGSYSSQDLRGFIEGSVSLGLAPATVGVYTISTIGGSGGYNAHSGSLSITVSSAPAINVNFSLDEIRRKIKDLFL